jgi:hypothetical protein
MSKEPFSRWKKNKENAEIARQKRINFLRIPRYDNIIDEMHTWHHINNKYIVAMPRDLHTNARMPDNPLFHKFFCYQIIKQIYANEIPYIYKKIN